MRRLLAFLLCTQFASSCLDLLFAIDSTSESSYSQAIRVAQDVSLRPDIRTMVAVNRIQHYTAKTTRLGGELIQTIENVKGGDYDRILNVVTVEVTRKRDRPLIVLLFSDKEVNKTLMSTWKHMKRGELHIFRVGLAKQTSNLLAETGPTYESLLQCAPKHNSNTDIRRQPQTNSITGPTKENENPTTTTTSIKPFSRTTHSPSTARTKTTGPKLRAVFRGGTTALIPDEDFQTLATTLSPLTTTIRITTAKSTKTTPGVQRIEKERSRSEFNFLRAEPKKLFIPAIKTTTEPPISTTLFRLTEPTTKPTTTTTSKPVPRGCVADIIFLVDLSQGTGDRTKHYFDVGASAVGALPIGANAVRVGMIGYSGPGRTHILFDLNKHTNKDDLIEEMFKMVATGGTTRTGEAITYATKELLKNDSNGSRANVKKVLVVFTDGYSQDDPMSAASNARHQGIRTIAVAMQDHISPNTAELLHIAGQKEYILLSPKGFQLRERILGTSCTLTAI